MPGFMHVFLAAATTALHGGLSERVLTTRKLNPTTTAKSRANTVTGVHAATTGHSEAPVGVAVASSPPLGAPSGSPAEDAPSATPRGRNMATIAVYRSSAGAITYRGCTIGQLSTISPTNSRTLNARAETASGQCGAVSLPSAMTTTATTIAHAPQISASCTAILGMLSGIGDPL